MNSKKNEASNTVKQALFAVCLRHENIREFVDRVGIKVMQRIIHEQVDRYILHLPRRYSECTISAIAAVILYGFKGLVDESLEKDLSWQLCKAKYDPDRLSALPEKFSWIRNRMKMLNDKDPRIAESLKAAITPTNKYTNEANEIRARRDDHEFAKIIGMMDEQMQSEVVEAFRMYDVPKAKRLIEGRIRSRIASLMRATGTSEADEDPSSQRTLSQPHRITVAGTVFDLTDIHTAEGVAKTTAGGAWRNLEEID